MKGMKARCVGCSSIIEFRNQRGSKLSARTCICGGKYEILSWAEVPENALPINSNFYGNYLKNKKGDVFYYDRTNQKAIIIQPPPHDLDTDHLKNK